ncbi:MAG: hypothetical protein HC888_19865, partial [Candidatus Competibacteraceae bacterium]|nr:hypothetical protein [Candidatus Competibacteraceae bacterium]
RPAGGAGSGGGAEGGAGHNLTASGNTGNNPGSGGSGAAVRNNSPFAANNVHQTGGKGGDGRIVVTYRTLAVNYTLATAATHGSISLSPAGGSYPSKTDVTLTAVPDAGYVFSGWSGDLAGTINPAIITMSGNRSVTAIFFVCRHAHRDNQHEQWSADADRLCGRSGHAHVSMASQWGGYRRGDVIELYHPERAGLSRGHLHGGCDLGGRLDDKRGCCGHL